MITVKIPVCLFFQMGPVQTFPVTDFADARFYIPLQRVHPMFSFQAGYSNNVGHRQEASLRILHGLLFRVPVAGHIYGVSAVGAREYSLIQNFNRKPTAALPSKSQRLRAAYINGVQDNTSVKNITL